MLLLLFLSGVAVSAAPSITVLSPNGGEVFHTDSTITVRWIAIDIEDDVEVEYSVDGGNRWRGIGKTAASAGSISWSISRTGAVCYVRVSDREGPTSDRSDASFVIDENPLDMTILFAPNGGETWTEGEKHAITWQAPLDAIDVMLEYSTNNGAVWTAITTVPATPASYLWTVPHLADVPIGTMSMRVSVAEALDHFDISNASFTIKPKPVVDPPDTTVDPLDSIIVQPAIKVLFPNGGEKFPGDTTIIITWSATDVNEEVEVEYSLDGGGDWDRIDRVGATAGMLEWNVPKKPSATALVRVITRRDGDVSDISDAFFEITEGISPVEELVEVLYPNGGESWTEGEKYTIRWNAPEDVFGVTIELTTDHGITWREIGRGAATPGAFEWTVPHLSENPIAGARIRVTDSLEIDHTDMSDLFFTILPRPVVASVETLPGRATLLGIYPNPAAGRADLRWRQEGTATVTVRLFDAAGNLVRRIDAGSHHAGEHHLDIAGSELPAGHYLCELNVGGAVAHHTLVIQR